MNGKAHLLLRSSYQADDGSTWCTSGFHDEECAHLEHSFDVKAAIAEAPDGVFVPDEVF